jgi:WD40 repeat protein/tRNA A-37 threonylcarbamoyl transferase component Bud32
MTTPGSDRADPDEPCPDADRLAELDERLVGRDPASAAEGSRSEALLGADAQVDPDEVDLLLLLNQLGADHRARHQAGAGDRPLPDALGRFTILRQVGSGGFATVHQAIDRRLHRRVALKIARPEALLSDALRRRFVREAELAARLNHPHLVTVYEVAEQDGLVSIVEEFCDGGSLADWLSGHPGPASPVMAARIVRALADAVESAHARGIYHRDIKPANVLLATAATDPLIPPDPEMGSPDTAAGRGCTVKLGDFGLGKLSDDAGEADPLSALTRAGSRIGTPAWMAPEQIDRSIGPIGPPTDVHALGLLLDRLLTGSCRYAGQSESDTLRRVLLAEPVPPDRLVPRVPADLAAVCAKCLAKRPADRYLSAAALRDDLDRFLTGRATVARPLSAGQRLTRAIRRRPAVFTTALAAAVAVLAGGLALQARYLQRQEAARRLDDVRSRDAAAELRRGFELWRSASGGAAADRLAACAAIDPELASSLAGRWLEARLHGEEALLLPAPTSSPTTLPDGGPPDIYCLRLSHDGRRLAAGAADGRLLLLDIGDDDRSAEAIGSNGGRSERVIQAHDEINDVAISPDDRLVATVGQDGRARLWSLADGRPVRDVAADEAPLFAVGFSPDGRTLAWGGNSREIHVEPIDASGDASGPRVVWRPFPDEPDRDEQPDLEAFVFSDDDSLVAVSGRSVLRINAETGEVERTYPGHRPNLGLVVLSPDRRLMLTAGTDRQPRLWDVEHGTLLATLPMHPHWVHGATFGPDAAWIATGCRDGVVRVFGPDGTARNRLVGHVGRTWDLQCDTKGRVISSGADGTIRAWNPITPLTTAGCRSLAARGARFRDLAPGPRPRQLIGMVEHAKPVPAVGPVTIDLGPKPGLDADMPAPLPLTNVAIDPFDGRRAAGDADGGVIVWNGAEPRRLPPTERRPVVALAWLPGGGLAVALWGEPPLPLLAWGAELEAARIVDSFPRAAECLAVSTTNRPRLAVGVGPWVVRYDLDAVGQPLTATGRRILELQTDGAVVTALAWSGDGRRLAVGTRQGDVMILDAESGREQVRLTPLPTAITGLAFSADGRAVVAADQSIVRLCDAVIGITYDDLQPGWPIDCVGLARWPDAPAETWLVVGGGSIDTADSDAASARLVALPLTGLLAPDARQARTVTNSPSPRP